MHVYFFHGSSILSATTDPKDDHLKVLEVFGYGYNDSMFIFFVKVYFSFQPLLTPISQYNYLKVLEVVRSNYDTLTLKLQDSLDHFEKYAEKAKESSFFTQLVSPCRHAAQVNPT